MPGDESNTYTSIHPAITDVVSRNFDNIVLVYGNSNTDTYNALAFQVTRAVRRVERADDLVTNLSDTGTEGFGWVGGSGFSTNTNNPGDEVFAIDESQSSTIVEYGFAVPQDGVYVGVQTGDGEAISGLREGNLRLRQLTPSDLDLRAGVLSDYTAVNTPSGSNSDPIPTTALSERPDQGLVRIDSEQDGPNRFFFAFENQSGGQTDIDLVGHGMTYEVRPITNTDTVRSILAGDGYSRRILQYGGFDNENPNLPTGWYDYRAEIGPGQLTP